MSEHPVDGMRGGNLSGLALCGKDLWAVSDRDDEQIYRLDISAPTWQAETVKIDVPPVPESGLPWGLRSRTKAASFIRGGDLDFEGITCDAPVTATLSARPMRRCCRCRCPARLNG